MRILLNSSAALSDPLLKPNTHHGANFGNVQAPESLERLFSIWGVWGVRLLGHRYRFERMPRLEGAVLVADWG